MPTAAKIQLPSIKELQKELTRLKGNIDDDMVDWDNEEPTPCMDITLGASETGYAIQTGDNSYTGAAYGHAHWGVGTLCRRTNCTELAKDLIEQCRELFESCQH